MTRILAWIRDPFRNKSGAPTRLALAAQAWGKSAPKVRRDASKLVRKGRTFLQRARSKQVHSKKRKA